MSPDSAEPLQAPPRLTDQLAALLMQRIESGELAPDERKEKVQIMQRILRTDAEIRCLAEPWLNDLAQIIDRNSAAPTH